VTVGRLSSAALTLAIGYAAAAGLFWTLLNVPESTVLSLLTSLFLLLLIVSLIGLTTAAAVAVAESVPTRTIMGRATAALPAFIIGITIFAALWWLSGVADGMWSRSRGEIDAWLLRYLGVTRSAPLHAAERWTLWLLRWGVGVSVVVALVTVSCVGAIGRLDAVRRGLRTAVGLTPLAAVTLAALAASEGLWRAAAWRPQGLPPSSVELLFVVVKLALLYLVFVVIVAAVLDIHRRAAQRVLSR
jgi:hypothetical protein